MTSSVREWLNLTVRWFHVFAAIMWVGQTYYFTWLDGRFTELEKKARAGGESGGSPENHIWMVHSGGFYVVEKQKIPNAMPGKHDHRQAIAIGCTATLARFSCRVLVLIVPALQMLSRGC